MNRETLQRKCACDSHGKSGGGCGACRKKASMPLQRAAIRPGNIHEVPPIVHDVLRSPGKPLDAETRAFMEPRFGHDFSRVRVHGDAKAAESARSVHALAYTVGHDVVFGSGAAPHATHEGRQLLAHELAHVVQQSSGPASPLPQAYGGRSDDAAEREADHAAERIVSGGLAGRLGAAVPSLHRKLMVDNAKDPIPNPTGKGVVQTNAVTVQGYLRTLCSDGSVKVDGATGDVTMDPAFCPTPYPPDFVGPPAPSPLDSSKEPAGCGCLCDMVGASTQYHILVNDSDWPHTAGTTVTTVSPNTEKLWGAATVSGKTTPIDPWLVLGHELCGHAWLAEKKLPDENATRGEGGHQETVERENLLRAEHGMEARGGFKDPYCGESFWQTKAGPGPVQWSKYLKKCEAWRKKKYGKKYKISDKIP